MNGFESSDFSDERLIEALSTLRSRPELDDIAHLAAVVCDAPVAVLGLFAGGVQKVLSSWRWKVAELPAATAFTSSVIQGPPEGIVIPDALASPEFAGDLLVRMDPKIRFFAAMPIRVDAGPAFAGLSVFGQKPHSLSKEQMSSLRALANVATATLRLMLEASEAERLRNALAEMEQRSRDLFETADDLIMSIDAEGGLVHVNHATLTALGHEPGEIARMTIFDLLHPDVRAEFSDSFREVVASGTRRRVETVFLAAAGRRITVDGTLIPKTLDGRTALVRVIFRDVSDRKRFETEIGRARDAALEAARLKTQFLTNVTHEVRTPMNVIVGMLDLLQNSSLDGEQSDLVRTAQASSSALLELISNILHVSSLEAGSLSVTAADFDLVSSVSRVVEVMKVVAQEKNLKIATKIDEAIPAVLRGDVARFRQILTNLLSNAVKFTESGQIDVNVGIERETALHVFVRVDVADTGIGIPSDAIPHLFDTFYQVDSSAKRRYSGLGLGLATAKKAVELMNGAIGAESREGEGSRFWFTIPFEKRAARDIAIAARKSALTGTKAILYDGSATSRKMVTQFLGMWGVRCRSAASRAELVDRVRGDAALGDPYRVAILDLHAPDGNGLSLARELRSDPALKDTSVVLLCSLGETLNDEEIRAAGVNGYLAKPVEQSELFDCLMAVLVRTAGVVAPAPAPVPSTPEEGGATSSGPPRHLEILIAEDKPLNQKLTLSQLRNLGQTADIANDGDEVIAAVRRKDYDIIFMDCQMPLRDGYETTAEIRRIEAGGRRVRIVAMTANAREGDRERCIAAGMDDYLSKPTTQRDLEVALRKCVTPEVGPEV